MDVELVPQRLDALRAEAGHLEQLSHGGRHLRGAQYVRRASSLIQIKSAGAGCDRVSLPKQSPFGINVWIRCAMYRKVLLPEWLFEAPGRIISVQPFDFSSF